MDAFHALVARQDGDRITASVETLSLSDLPPGEDVYKRQLPILAPGGVASALTHWGSADQQATYLGEFAGENAPQACVAIAEPQPLFDPTRLKTTAVRTPSGYRLDGVKSLVPAAADAELFILGAQLNGKPALFIVESSAKGLTVKADPSMGIRAAALGQVELSGVSVPLNARLGEGEATDDDYSCLLYTSMVETRHVHVDLGRGDAGKE